MTNERLTNKQEQKERVPVRRNNYRGRRNSNQEKKGEEKILEVSKNILETKQEDQLKGVQSTRSTRNTRNSRSTRNTRTTDTTKKAEGRADRRSYVKLEEKAGFEFKKENLKIIPLRRIRRNWKKYNGI